MTTLIAQHTIQGARIKRVVNADGTPLVDEMGNPRFRRMQEVVIPPGGEFDPADLGIDDEEARALILSGAVQELGRLTGSVLDPATDVLLHPPEGGGLDELPSDETLMAMTRAQLEALAVQRGLDITKAKSKADVIAALVDALEA